MAVLNVSATLTGGATLLQATISWRSHPGSSPGLPASNSALTLEQFKAATGPSKGVSKSPPAVHTIVDPNPPRKPFTPR